MERFSTIVGQTREHSGQTLKFKELAALYKSMRKADEPGKDELDPGKSHDELYQQYNKEIHGITDGKQRRGIAERLNNSELSDDDFNDIENEASRRKQTHFDMEHFHDELKSRNLWQGHTRDKAAADDEHDEINSLMDEIAGRPLTLDEVDEIAENYVKGYVGSDDKYKHPDGHFHNIKMDGPSETRVKARDLRGEKKEPQYGAHEHQKQMADVARENQRNIDAGGDADKPEDVGVRDGMPVGAGWTAIPGGDHGGYRRSHGGKHEYWYPTHAHAADASEHHYEQSERYKNKLGRALRSGEDANSDTLGRLLDAHVHHENESRRALTHHKEHSKKEGPHVSSHEKSMYRAAYLSLLVKSKKNSNGKLSRKIKKLVGEGYPQKQAVGIALQMHQAGKLESSRSYRQFAMGVYFKAAAYDRLDPHNKLKQKPPGGEEMGWEPMKRTRHRGWQKLLANGQKKYWYPTPVHAQHAEVDHRKQSNEAQVNARSAETPGRKQTHELASREHTQSADGAKKFHEDARRAEPTVPASGISDNVLHVFSKIMGKPVKSGELKTVKYRKVRAGKELVSLEIQMRSKTKTITSDMLERYDVDLTSLCEFLESGGAQYLE